jgi:hypothetical protein
VNDDNSIPADYEEQLLAVSWWRAGSAGSWRGCSRGGGWVIRVEKGRQRPWVFAWGSRGLTGGATMSASGGRPPRVQRATGGDCWCSSVEGGLLDRRGARCGERRRDCCSGQWRPVLECWGVVAAAGGDGCWGDCKFATAMPREVSGWNGSLDSAFD